MNPDGAQAMARAGRLYPAVILHGAGIEQRREAAIALARTLLCEVAAEDRPCGRCRHCRRVIWPGGPQELFHPDFRVLERDLKTATSVEATRSLLQTAQVTPFEARGQVFVIASAESLSGGAANSLLKTLEEPHLSAPRHFLLLAPTRQDLLPTLRSRSMAVFLGSAGRPAADLTAQAAAGFADSLTAWLESGATVHLMAAAAGLADAGDWSDPRAAGPWSASAAAVLQTIDRLALEPPARRALLELAEELLDGPRARLRGITALRILEGLVCRHLTPIREGPQATRLARRSGGR